MVRRTGQIILLLLFVLVVLVTLVLLNVDVFVAVRAKHHIQNAGDAAAIAAAHKQGSLLNEIGHLNVAHIVAAIKNDTNECRQIVLEQRKKALLGPVEALRFANNAAKKNGMEVRDEFSEILRRHIEDIRLVYSGAGGDGEPYPEPFPGAWVDYATAIANVISEGLATGPDNMEFYDCRGGHLLLNRHFYHAIAARDWCWFFFNCNNVLSDYTSYRDWGPLPVRDDAPYDNSEIFSLHVISRKMALTDVFSKEEILAFVERYSDVTLTAEDLDKSELISSPEESWFFFSSDAWKRWFNGLALAGDEYGYEFPIAGEIKEEYNVSGCASVCRCVGEVDAVAVSSHSAFTWSAAAKPFGSVDSFEGVLSSVTALKNFVVPSFTDVRLIPLDAAAGGNLATADYGWVVHIREHLGEYLERGPRYENGCFYCLQLQTWERDYFRREGVIWLKYNSGSCRRPVGGGPGGHGGTSHGH